MGGWLLNSRAILHPALASPVVKFDGRIGKKLLSYGSRQQPFKTLYVYVCVRLHVHPCVCTEFRALCV